MMRRTYYDHEPAYRRIDAAGGRGWDDLHPPGARDSYASLQAFMDSAIGSLVPSRGRVIDLGCGGGQASIMMARLGWSVVGVDFSPTAIRLAEMNAAAAGMGGAEFRIADCLSMPEIASGSFDLAIDNHVLHCIIGADDRRRFLREVSRVLRPGGVLFSETMSAEGSLDYAALGVDPDARVDGHRTRFWVTERELRNELAAAGFEVLSLERRSQVDRPNPGDTMVVVSQRV